jgi:hypothetical protein
MRVVMKIHILRCTPMSHGRSRYGAKILQPGDEWISYVHNKLEEIKEKRAEAAGENAK